MPSSTDCESNFERQVAVLFGASEDHSLDVLIRQGAPLSAIDRVAEYGVNAGELGIISKNALKRRLNKGKPLTPLRG